MSVRGIHTLLVDPSTWPCPVDDGWNVHSKRLHSYSGAWLRNEKHCNTYSPCHRQRRRKCNVCQARTDNALDVFKMPHRALAIEYVWSMYRVWTCKGPVLWRGSTDQPISPVGLGRLDGLYGASCRWTCTVVCEGDCNGEPWMLAVLRMAWVISYSNSGMIRPGLLEIATTTAPKRIRHFSSFSARFQLFFFPGVYICIPSALPSIFAP